MQGIRMHGSSLILNIQMQFTYLVVLHILCDVLKKVHNYRVVKSRKEYICLLILLSFFRTKGSGFYKSPYQISSCLSTPDLQAKNISNVKFLIISSCLLTLYFFNKLDDKRCLVFIWYWLWFNKLIANLTRIQVFVFTIYIQSPCNEWHLAFKYDMENIQHNLL